jgi:hypothetical protein
MTDAARARAHALVDELCGPPDEAADRAVAVLHAHAAALAWVRAVTRSYPAPKPVARRLETAAARLRSGEDDRDPARVLIEVATSALQGPTP